MAHLWTCVPQDDSGAKRSPPALENTTVAGFVSQVLRRSTAGTLAAVYIQELCPIISVLRNSAKRIQEISGPQVYRNVPQECNRNPFLPFVRAADAGLWSPPSIRTIAPGESGVDAPRMKPER